MPSLNNILRSVSRPARYTGGEWNTIKKPWDAVDVRIALAYPDVYEIGMSNLGLAILYDLLNAKPHILAERVYAPWPDMAAAMRRSGTPLFSLESRNPISAFDIVGFSLGYELTYTNVLEMLDLAQIPLFASERDMSHPLVIAGGSCTLNPEPMAEFIDLFLLGDGEEVVLELVAGFARWTEGAANKETLLAELSLIPGIYVPGHFRAEYQPDGRIASIMRDGQEQQGTITRRIVAELPPPTVRQVVPFVEAVHDRGAVEIQRGCTRGCRFCQAGTIYRPLRERPPQEVFTAVDGLISNCGYDEIALLSLSTGDYSGIDSLVSSLAERYQGTHLNLSLPSLRPDTFSRELASSIRGQRQGSLTFAPEVGTERMQKVTNKRISADSLLSAVGTALDHGWTSFKLYFMIGLPTETEADVEGIVALVQRVRQMTGSAGKRPNVRVNAATFVPRPHTPFQWVRQNTAEELLPKHQILKRGLRKAEASLSWADPKVSLLEGVLSRGDRRLARVIHRAWQLGSVFDAWNELFSYDNWIQAFDECGIDSSFHVRERQLDEILPWAHIDAGVAVDFLKREYARAMAGEETPDCRSGKCSACGLQRWEGACRIA